jgi:5-methylcytosine-specific restriction protein A
LYSEEIKSLSESHPAIIDLSEILNRLPIVPKQHRSEKFRNAAGVSSQLSRFQWSLKHNKHANIGMLFFKVYDEYRYRMDELHNIAQTIRRCESVLNEMNFGADIEAEGFPEGAILSHLHRNWEKQYGKKHIEKVFECEICCIRPQHIYVGGESIPFLEAHLLAPLTEYGPNVTFNRDDFIAVCPNCHRVLHQTRPWLSREQCENILITFRQG